MNTMYRIIYILFLTLLAGACSPGHREEDDHDEDHHQHAGDNINPEVVAEFGIELDTVMPGPFNDVIRTSGEIEASASDMYNITAKRSGILTLSPGINEGVNLKKGEKLGNISSEGVQGGDLSAAAKANLKAAKAEMERLKPLFEEGLVTASVYREAERQYEEAKALSSGDGVSGALTVSSPIEGTLQRLYVKSGDYVEVGGLIATVGKNSNMTLKVDLPARERKHLNEINTAHFIPEGSKEIVKISDLNGKKISGNSASSTNGYLTVYFSFAGNPMSYPGGYAEVFLICNERRNVVSVPVDALLEIQGNKYIYVFEDGHGYEKRLVRTGSSDGERIEILEGLDEGDLYVSKGASIVRMAEVSSVAPPAHTHNH